MNVVFATNFENFVTWMRTVNTLNFRESKYLLNKKDTMMIFMTVFSNVFIVDVIQVLGDSMVLIYSEKC